MDISLTPDSPSVDGPEHLGDLIQKYLGTTVLDLSLRTEFQRSVEFD
ncbi:MAG: hypothetical protein PHN51_06690 [Candidatus Nanopelagicales bacterium]|nr:hypothetical protein [Candidatus Nanopelagicales bacterium]